MLDAHLAKLYGVPTKQLNQQVRRNLRRFPADFMFRLKPAEADSLRSQFVTSKDGRGGRRYLPLVFTEQGVAMLSSVLNSERAIQVNIIIMRAFVKFRQELAFHQELALRLHAQEKKCSSRFHTVLRTLRKLMEPPPLPPKRPIGFLARF